MSIRTGREFLSIPGPTNVPDPVLNALHQPAIEIYSGRLKDITRTCLEDLKKIFRTAGDTYIYIANGHGAWEAALTNSLSRGDKVLVLESGRFAVGWGQMGQKLGIEMEVLAGDWHRAVDPEKVEERLRADVNKEIKAILVVQVDTASSVVNDIPAIRRAIDNAGHPALFMVDTIASLATMPFEMDEWGVDVAVAGSQKGLMMPPGLSYNAVGPKGKLAHKTADLRTQYWDWTAREAEIHYLKYCGTPPVHMLFAMRTAFDMLFEDGMENIFKRHSILSRAVHAAVEKWSEAGALTFNVQVAGERAPSVTTVNFQDQYNAEQFLDYCDQKLAVVLGIGIGEGEEQSFRIAHMGFVNAPMILGTLSGVEIGLKALNIPHGSGAIEAAIEIIAEAVPAEPGQK